MRVMMMVVGHSGKGRHGNVAHMVRMRMMGVMSHGWRWIGLMVGMRRHALILGRQRSAGTNAGLDARALGGQTEFLETLTP